ncbi:MAG: DUF3846 domain-containing protein [Clostridia bacterium]|nr:DUF3846 domain-containing protein [Clostridia bacterium]
MKAILINTDRSVREVELDNTLEAMQEQVGGHIEAVPLRSGLMAICNEDGKLEELPPVALILSPDGSVAYDTLCGPVLVCRTKGSEFADIQPGDEERMRRSLFVLPAVKGAYA